MHWSWIVWYMIIITRWITWWQVINDDVIVDEYMILLQSVLVFGDSRPLDETVKHATIDSLKKTALPLQLYQQVAIAPWYMVLSCLVSFLVYTDTSQPERWRVGIVILWSYLLHHVWGPPVPGMYTHTHMQGKQWVSQILWKTWNHAVAGSASVVLWNWRLGMYTVKMFHVHE